MILKITKEEYPVAIATLVVIAAFTTLTILSYPDIFFKSGKLGYWTIFYKNFRMSGYDCWSFITLSNLRVHFETSSPQGLSELNKQNYCKNKGIMNHKVKNYP